jgi:mannose-6-phosphate isomerase-like protein (cupin superfamily)
MGLPTDLKDIQIRVIGSTPKMMTAIVWIKEMVPQEVHVDEHEKFLIVEGTCEITVGEDVYSFTAGDFMQIPLHKKHHVKVTSVIPCKVLLQREKIAA